MKRQEYIVEASSISAELHEVESNCVDIEFINYGTGILFINDVIELAQNQTWKAGGNSGEIDRTIYRVKFGAGTTKATAIRRIYRG